MSYKVTLEALEESQSQYADRLVLLAIAEVAWHDGVGWLPQGWATGDSDEARKRSIAWRAKVSAKQASRSVGALEELDELEVRTTQDGRRRYHIYRVIVGRLRAVEVDYDHLDKLLDRPFSTVEELLLERQSRPANLSGRREGETATPASIALTRDPAGRTDNLSGREQGGRPDISSPDDRTSRPSPYTGARGAARSFTPSKALAAAAEHLNTDTDAALLADALRGLRAGAQLREAAFAEPARALAWVKLAKEEAKRNPAGFVLAGLASGDWPSPRAAEQTGRMDAHRRWAQDESWQIADVKDAHDIVDDFRHLDDVDRQELHELVDRIRVERSKSAEVAA